MAQIFRCPKVYFPSSKQCRKFPFHTRYPEKAGNVILFKLYQRIYVAVLNNQRISFDLVRKSTGGLPPEAFQKCSKTVKCSDAKKRLGNSRLVERRVIFLTDMLRDDDGFVI
jgi:hypothetical protein